MNRITQEQLSKTIKTKREQLGMSQLDLAKKTKINRAMISKIENNTYMPSISQLEDLQEVLGFSFEEIRENNTKRATKHESKPRIIAVAGTGYVGMSIAVLLAQHNEVIAVDVVEEKVKLINKKKSPIQDDYIEEYLKGKDLNLEATLDAKHAYKNAEFVVVAAPTNYDPKLNFFDTSLVEQVIELVLSVNKKATSTYNDSINVG